MLVYGTDQRRPVKADPKETNDGCRPRRLKQEIQEAGCAKEVSSDLPCLSTCLVLDFDKSDDVVIPIVGDPTAITDNNSTQVGEVAKNLSSYYLSRSGDDISNKEMDYRPDSTPDRRQRQQTQSQRCSPPRRQDEISGRQAVSYKLTTSGTLVECSTSALGNSLVEPSNETKVGYGQQTSASQSSNSQSSKLDGDLVHQQHPKFRPPRQTVVGSVTVTSVPPTSAWLSPRNTGSSQHHPPVSTRVVDPMFSAAYSRLDNNSTGSAAASVSLKTGSFRQRRQPSQPPPSQPVSSKTGLQSSPLPRHVRHHSLQYQQQQQNVESTAYEHRSSRQQRRSQILFESASSNAHVLDERHRRFNSRSMEMLDRIDRDDDDVGHSSSTRLMSFGGPLRVSGSSTSLSDPSSMDEDDWCRWETTADKLHRLQTEIDDRRRRLNYLLRRMSSFDHHRDERRRPSAIELAQRRRASSSAVRCSLVDAPLNRTVCFRRSNRYVSPRQQHLQVAALRSQRQQAAALSSMLHSSETTKLIGKERSASLSSSRLYRSRSMCLTDADSFGAVGWDDGTTTGRSLSSSYFGSGFVGSVSTLSSIIDDSDDMRARKIRWENSNLFDSPSSFRQEDRRNKQRAAGNCASGLQWHQQSGQDSRHDAREPFHNDVHMNQTGSHCDNEPLLSQRQATSANRSYPPSDANRRPPATRKPHNECNPGTSVSGTSGSAVVGTMTSTAMGSRKARDQVTNTSSLTRKAKLYSGKIEVALSYFADGCSTEMPGGDTLCVRVIQAVIERAASVNVSENSPSPTLNPLARVSLQLPPNVTREIHVQRQQSTACALGTMNPSWRQSLTFQDPPCRRDWPSTSVRVTVWDRDRFLPDRLIGETTIKLRDGSMVDGEPRWYRLRMRCRTTMESGSHIVPDSDNDDSDADDGQHRGGSGSSNPGEPTSRNARQSTPAQHPDVSSNRTIEKFSEKQRNMPAYRNQPKLLDTLQSNADLQRCRRSSRAPLAPFYHPSSAVQETHSSTMNSPTSARKKSGIKKSQQHRVRLVSAFRKDDEHHVTQTSSGDHSKQLPNGTLPSEEQNVHSPSADSTSSLCSDDVYSLWLSPGYTGSERSSSRCNASLGPGQILPSSLVSNQAVSDEILSYYVIADLLMVLSLDALHPSTLTVCVERCSNIWDRLLALYQRRDWYVKLYVRSYSAGLRRIRKEKTQKRICEPNAVFNQVFHCHMECQQDLLEASLCVSRQGLFGSSREVGQAVISVASLTSLMTSVNPFSRADKHQLVGEFKLLAEHRSPNFHRLST